MPIATTYYFQQTPLSFRTKTGFKASPGEKYVSNNAYFKTDAYWTPEKDFSIGVSHLMNEFGPSTDDINRVYDKVKEKLIGPKGECLTSLVEWKSSLGMITQRVVQLGSAYSAVKKLQFGKAARILKLSPKQSKTVEGRIRSHKGSFSPTSAWLEYWMGWAPLHGEITHALNTLTKPPPLNNHFSVGVMLRRSPIIQKYRDALEDWETNVQHTGKYSCYGNFSVTNSNALLLNRLGFINPVLTAWQIVPFSFIVDWFVNVGTVIGALTDFVGIDISRTGYSIKGTIEANGKRHRMEYDPTNTYYTNPKRYIHYYVTGHGHREFVRRSPGPIQTPRLRIVMLDKLSLTRALTSVSLLTEIFLKK